MIAPPESPSEISTPCTKSISGSKRKLDGQLSGQQHKEQKNYDEQVNPVDQALLNALKDDTSTERAFFSDPDITFTFPILRGFATQEESFGKKWVFKNCQLVMNLVTRNNCLKSVKMSIQTVYR